MQAQLNGVDKPENGLDASVNMSASSINSSANKDNYTFSLNIKVVIIILGCLILSFITVFGNLLTIIAYYKNKKLQRSSNIILVSLALADLIIGLVPLNLRAICIAFQSWPFGKTSCNLLLSIEMMCCQSSIYHILLVTSDRYISIKNPLTHRVKHTKHRIKLCLVLVWALSFIQWAPWILCYQYISQKKSPDNNKCEEMLFLTENPYLTYVEAILGFYGPLVCVFIVYMNMYRLIKQSLHESIRKNTSASVKVQFRNSLSVSVTVVNPNELGKVKLCSYSEESNDCKKKKVNKKYFKMITLILLVFVVTWLPYSMQMMLHPYCSGCISVIAFDLSYFLTYINSAANPFIYAFSNKHFRTEFKSIIARIINKKK